MDWKKVGIALVVWGLLGGVVAAGMAFLPEASDLQKGRWAVDCFRLGTSCEEQRAHDVALAEWRTRAWVVGGVSTAMIVIGLSVVAGAGRKD